MVVGGGLGSTPFPARVLDEFVAPGELLVTIRAVVKVFAEYGNRRNKMKARLKFVVHRQGIEEFRRKVAAVVAATTPGERAEAELLDYVPERDRPTVAAHLAGRLAPSILPARRGRGAGRHGRERPGVERRDDEPERGSRAGQVAESRSG